MPRRGARRGASPAGRRRAAPALIDVAGGRAGGVVRVAGQLPGRRRSRSSRRGLGTAASRAEETTAECTSMPGQVDRAPYGGPVELGRGSAAGARASGSRPSRGRAPAAPRRRRGGRARPRSSASARRARAGRGRARERQPGGGGVHVRVDERRGDQRPVELDDLVGAGRVGRRRRRPDPGDAVAVDEQGGRGRVGRGCGRAAAQSVAEVVAHMPLSARREAAPRTARARRARCAAGRGRARRGRARSRCRPAS